MKAIRDHAFIATEYPVIISIENHCKEKHQDIMAGDLVELLGAGANDNAEPGPDFLWLPASHNFVVGDSLPSPADLRRKILIRDKCHDAKEQATAAQQAKANANGADLPARTASRATSSRLLVQQATAPDGMDEFIPLGLGLNALVAIGNKRFPGIGSLAAPVHCCISTDSAY